MLYRLRSRRDFILGAATGLLVPPLYRTVAAAVSGRGQIPPGTAIVHNRVGLAAMPRGGSVAYLTESGREGLFKWDGSNLSSRVKADVSQGLYMPPDSDSSGESGAWARTFDGPMHVKWFGAEIDGSTDDTDAYQGIAALHAVTGGEVDLGSGATVVRGQIRFVGSIAVHGNITIDATTAKVDEATFPPAAGGSQSGLLFDGGDLTRLPPLARDAVPGTSKLLFASPHGLMRNVTVTLWNSATGSFSHWRDYYYDGEHARVAEVISETEVMLNRPLRARLTAKSSRCFRRPMKGIKLVGRLRYQAPAALHTGCRLRNLDDSVVDNLDVSGGASAASNFDKCFGVTGRAVKIMHYGFQGKTDYGLLVSNSQAVRISESLFRGRRHAVTLGGDGAAGAVPCRDIDIEGEYTNDRTSDVTAINVHGNAEDYVFRGVSHGGVTLGGDRGAFHGEAYNPMGTNLYSVHFAELLGTSFRLDGSRVYSTGNPNHGGQARGVINLGGNEQSMNDNTDRGGVISLRNVELHCPKANRPIVMRNRGCTTADLIGIDMTGLKLLTSAEAPVLAFGAVTGRPWNTIWIAGIELPKSASWSGAMGAIKSETRAGLSN